MRFSLSFFAVIKIRAQINISLLQNVSVFECIRNVSLLQNVSNVSDFSIFVIAAKLRT